MPQTICSILGTRPEIIRTSRILPKLDKHCNHIIVHTNQNWSPNLKDIFFSELRLRQPDICFKSSIETATHTEFGLGNQLANMFPQIEKIFKDVKPDKIFILGDTNSALCAIMAERMGIPVYHMESSNRSFNRAIPEEVNRRLIDSISTYNLFYTPTNRHTLLKEGCDPKKIFQCGNPTLEVMEYYKDDIESSDVLERLLLAPKGGPGEGGICHYCLADFHRTENVDSSERLAEIVRGLNLIAEQLHMQIICSIHPRTKSKLDALKYTLNDKIKFLDAMGFFDFQKLEQFAAAGLTDSGLCSEEYCLYHIPCVIVRNETERPEVVEAGGAIISGVNATKILESTQRMVSMENRNWPIPSGYDDLNVSEKVVNYILGAKQ